MLVIGQQSLSHKYVTNMVTVCEASHKPDGGGAYDYSAATSH